jgi:hypothetical protein
MESEYSNLPTKIPTKVSLQKMISMEKGNTDTTMVMSLKVSLKEEREKVKASS